MSLVAKRFAFRLAALLACFRRSAVRISPFMGTIRESENADGDYDDGDCGNDCNRSFAVVRLFDCFVSLDGCRFGNPFL